MRDSPPPYTKHPTFTRFSAAFLQLFFVFILCNNSMAQNTPLSVKPNAKKPYPVPSPTPGSGAIGSGLNTGKNAIARSYLRAVTATDNFLSGRPLEREINNSYIKLETTNSYFTDREARSGASLSGRLELPQTSERLQLFFDSDDDSGHSLEERTRPVSTGEQVQKSNSILGLEFLGNKKKKGWKFSARVGAKMRTLPRSFSQVRLQHNWKLSPNWQLRLRNDLWYLAASGPGNSTRISFQRHINERYIWRLITEFDYSDEFQTLDYLHQSIFSQKLSNSLTFHYRLGKLTTYNGAERNEKVFFAINIRKKMYRDWIYFTLTPEFFIDPQEESPDDHFSLTGKFEFFFSEK